jgi:hypothetical protein
MLTNILVNIQAYKSNTFEFCMNKFKIANLYNCKSRAITITKLKKNPHVKSQVHSSTLILIIIPVKVG